MEVRWSREVQLILDIISNELFSADKALDLEPIDWDIFLAEYRHHTVASLIYEGLSQYKEKIPADVYEKIAAIGLQNVYSNLHVIKQHIDLGKLLDNNHIKYCILKGCASAHYYPKPYLRCMGDVDFLIDKQDIKRTTELILQQGYIKTGNNHSFHECFKKKGSVLEMHYEISRLPLGEAGDRIRDLIKDIINKSETTLVDETGECKIPNWFHHGLIILIHMQRHMMREGIGLRHLCDWAVYINRLDACQREMLKKNLEIIGLWRFAQIMSQAVIVFLGVSYDEIFGKIEADLCCDVMEDILNSGNFGRKDEDSFQSSIFVSDRVKTTKNHSVIGQAFISLNDIVYNNWPISKKIKIMLPFGYVFFTCRYVIRSILGKRKKINVKKMLSKGQKRKHLYDQLHVYELKNCINK